MEVDLARKKQNRFLFLEQLYKVTNGREHTSVVMWELGESIGFSRNETQTIAEYLVHAGLIKLVALGGKIAITYNGINLYEDALDDKVFTNEVQEKPSTININNYGSIIGQQIGGANNTQNVTVKPEQNIGEIIAGLKVLLIQSTLSELDKEDAVEALDRVNILSSKDHTQDVIQRIDTRLGIVDSIIQKTQNIYEKAKPMLFAIKLYFGLSA